MKGERLEWGLIECYVFFVSEFVVLVSNRIDGGIYFFVYKNYVYEYNILVKLLMYMNRMYVWIYFFNHTNWTNVLSVVFCDYFIGCTMFVWEIKIYEIICLGSLQK